MSSVAVQREQRRQTLALPITMNKSIGTLNSTNDSPFEQVGHGDSLRYSLPYLPEDIWRHIHSLMPMSDAARAACVSRSFLSSWRFHPNLTLHWKTLCTRASRGKLRRKIDRILRNHSGIVKILKLNLADEYSTYPCIDRWLKVAVTPGIEELTLTLYKKYSFACSLLSDGVRDSIRCLQLNSCAFHPMAELGPLRKLTKLRLCGVHITGDELECLLSNSPVLDQLGLCECNKISFLKIPCVLQHLSCLSVIACRRLQVIVCEAPNLSSISLCAGIKLSLGKTLTMRALHMRQPNVVCYARAELPSIMPNLETMELGPSSEAVNNLPMLPTKFLYLKHLAICITQETFSPPYDYFFLVSFLDASPSLETLYLNVSQEDMAHESIVEGSSPHLRQLPELSHDCLKNVEIVGFNSAKSLVELTCCIVKAAISLERLVLDTLRGGHRSCCRESSDKRWPSTVSNAVLKEASRAVVAVRSYIEDEVKPTTKFTLLGPCTRCHSIALDDPMLLDGGG